MDKPAQRTSVDLTDAASQGAASLATVPVKPSSSAYVIVLSCVAAIGGFLFGFDSGVINGTVDALAKAFGTQAAGTGFAVASVLLGCAVGAFGAGTLADSLGRRPTMLLNAVGLAGAYALYAIAAAISLPFVWAAVRETKGKTLEQMKDTTNLSQALGSVERI